MRLTVIGAGPGGYVAALRAAQFGAQVTVIEKEEVGGACLNWGCIPTKALSASAEALHRARTLDDFGITLSGAVHPDMRLIAARRDKIVATQIKGIRALFKSWGVTLLSGTARIMSPGQVLMTRQDGTSETLESDRIIIASGSRPAPFALAPFDGRRVLSSNDAVRLQEIPKSIIIIGAGVIGVEFASILRELGAEVTVLEIMPRALSTEDEAIAELLLREFKKRKIAVRTGVRVSSVSAGDAGVVVTLDSGDRLEAEQLLISIGRAFNTEDLGLEALGIKRGQRGEIAVDDRMETSVGGVYAVGDVTGGMLLAHKASREGVAAAMNACGFDARMRYDVIPAAIFTMPEIGSVGLREHQARERGIAVRIGTFPYRGLGKAHAMGEIAGLFKIIADATTDKVLGVHIIGSHASDIVHEGALAMLRGLTSGELAGLVHAHPTLSEGLQEAAEAVHGRAIHLPKP